MNLNQITACRTKKLIKRFPLLLLTSAFLLLPSLQVRAHTFHTSLTRLDFNAEEKTAEITIQVFAHDLAKALERRLGKQVNLDKSPDAAKIILEYLADNFVLKNKAGETKKFNWIGREQSADSVWLYVETSMPEGFAGATLKNSLFFELSSEQINLVTSRFAEKKSDLTFKPNDKPKILFSE